MKDLILQKMNFIIPLGKLCYDLEATNVTGWFQKNNVKKFANSVINKLQHYQSRRVEEEVIVLSKTVKNKKLQRTLVKVVDEN